MKTEEQRAIKMLLDREIISRSQLDLSVQHQRALSIDGQVLSILDVLVRDGFCSRKTLSEIEGSEDYGISIQRSLLPHAICSRYQIAPVRLDRGRLLIRAATPLNELQKQAILKACPEPATDISILPSDRASIQTILRDAKTEEAILSDCFDRLRRDEPTYILVQQAVNALLTESIDKRASDVHIELLENHNSSVSYRIDGEMIRQYLMPKRVIGPVMMRLKTLCGMDSAENRRPQDGRMSFNYRGRIVDFRDATLPSSGGEALTLRVLDATSIPTLDDMLPGQNEFLNTMRGLTKFKEKRGGLVIVSGNTGSGKSSTIYALELEMPRDRINLVTVENPMEFTVPFARQYQINPFLNQKMSDIERDLLRQDPDAVMVGEVRDSDSARIVFNMAESGHMCFSTTHTKSPIQTLHRMLGFFDSPEDKERAAYILAQFIQVIMSQKLVQKLCTHCRIKRPDGYYNKNQKGCSFCNHKGHKGRVLVHDSIVFNADESGRNHLYRSLLDGNYQDIDKIYGVTRYSRRDVAMRLCEQGFLSYDDAEELSAL